MRLINENGKLAESFKANGRQYKVLSAEDGIGLHRHSKLMQFATMAYFDAPLTGLWEQLQKANEYANSLVTRTPKLTDLIHTLKNMEEAVKQTSERKWDISAAACTLFIVREDEKLSDWTDELAESKLKDWNIAGIYEIDFFLLFMDLVQQYKAKYQELQKLTTQGSTEGNSED